MQLNCLIWKSQTINGEGLVNVALVTCVMINVDEL